MTCRHYFDVRLRVQCIALLKRPPQPAGKNGGDRGFAAARHAHENQNAWFHSGDLETPSALVLAGIGLEQWHKHFRTALARPTSTASCTHRIVPSSGCEGYDRQAVSPQGGWKAPQRREVEHDRRSPDRGPPLDAYLADLRRARHGFAAARLVWRLLASGRPGGVGRRLRDGSRSGARLDRAAISRAHSPGAAWLSIGAPRCHRNGADHAGHADSRWRERTSDPGRARCAASTRGRSRLGPEAPKEGLGCDDLRW